jgi:hypothetical protein
MISIIPTAAVSSLFWNATADRTARLDQVVKIKRNLDYPRQPGDLLHHCLSPHSYRGRTCKTWVIMPGTPSESEPSAVVRKQKLALGTSGDRHSWAPVDVTWQGPAIRGTKR